MASLGLVQNYLQSLGLEDPGCGNIFVVIGT